jgi:hypothetical protein
MGAVIGSAGESPSHANTLINLTLVDPRFLTGALICAHLQPHGLYHAMGAWSPLLSASDRLRELRFRRRLHLPAIIVLQRLHHMCGLPGAAAEHESTATLSRSTTLLQHVDDPYLLGLLHPEIWRHGASVSAQPLTRAIHLYF